jgi:hypothetical protein
MAEMNYGGRTNGLKVLETLIMRVAITTVENGSIEDLNDVTGHCRSFPLKHHTISDSCGGDE